jgi:hypothetical protein
MSLGLVVNLKLIGFSFLWKTRLPRSFSLRFLFRRKSPKKELENEPKGNEGLSVAYILTTVRTTDIIIVQTDYKEANQTTTTSNPVQGNLVSK